MIFGITDLATFILGTVFIVLLPGPNSLYVLSVAAGRGVAAGYQGALGIFLGDSILMFLAATGAASLLKALPTLFLLFRLVGAAYLGWIGMGLIRAAWRQWHTVDTDIPESRPRNLREEASPFRTALMISLMNPKAILFFVSFFIQFVDPGYEHPGLSFLILGLIVQLTSALYLSLLIFGGAQLAAAFRSRRLLAAGATGGVGVMFLAFSSRLAGANL